MKRILIGVIISLIGSGIIVLVLWIAPSVNYWFLEAQHNSSGFTNIALRFIGPLSILSSLYVGGWVVTKGYLYADSDGLITRFWNWKPTEGIFKWASRNSKKEDNHVN